MQERLQEGEKHGFLYTCAEYYLQPNTVDGIVHGQTIICRKLFAGHVVSSRPMKRKKNLLRMIITVLTTSSCPSFLRAMCSKQKSKIMQINGKKEKIVGWRLGFTSLGLPPSFLPITLHVCSQSTVNQNEKETAGSLLLFWHCDLNC